MIGPIQNWLARRRTRQFKAWLETQPDLKAKLVKASVDMAKVNNAAPSIGEAAERLRKALRTPSDR